MRALLIAGVSLRRMGRDRVALFFLLALPVLVILVVGASVRGFGAIRVGLVATGAGPAGGQVASQLRSVPSVEVFSYPSVTAVTTAERRGEVDVAVVLPPGMYRTLRDGGAVTVHLLAEQASTAQQAAATTAAAALGEYAGRVQAAQFTTSRVGGTFEDNLVLAAGQQDRGRRVAVRTRPADTEQRTLPQGFSYSAPTMLVLFVFLNAVAGAAIIITTRQLGLYERMLAGPVRAWSVVAGETLAMLGVALAQSVLIVGVGAVAFGVSWGDPLAAAILVVVWALVGAGAGTLASTVFRTPEQASAVGPAVGIALGMLGGCMWPLEIVGSAMQTVGHLTPQAWAVDAWTTLLSRRGTVADIAVQLGVLMAFAVGLLGLAALRFRRSLA